MIRKATMPDIEHIHKLLIYFGEKGLLLPRALSGLYDHIRDFMVYEENKKIVACSALHFCWENLAEIRSLAVSSDQQKKNIGTMLIEANLEEAKLFNITQVFTLTYIPSFFEKFGFKKITKDLLPQKIWADCLQCVKFPDCDEVAMMKNLD